MALSRKIISAEAALEWAEDLCSRAEYSSGEIRGRLLRKGLSAADADRIVDLLVDLRFIDDARFARAFIRDKVSFARWGRKKIVAALYQKRVTRGIIEECMEEIDGDEYMKRLVEVIESKLRSMSLDIEDLQYDDKVKIYRFAASRGFESSSISRALATLKSSKTR